MCCVAVCRSAGNKQDFDGETYTIEELTADRCVVCMHYYMLCVKD